MKPDPEQKDINESLDAAPEINISGRSGRRRRRIKIRKRIRIKKKPSAKKKIRKIAENIFWVLLIIAFITSLIVTVIQLDIKDEKLKQQKKRRTPAKSYSFAGEEHIQGKLLHFAS